MKISEGKILKLEDFINKEKVIDLSFFNFENAITAAYYANENLEIQKTNKNFAKFFPILGNGKYLQQPIFVKDVAWAIIEALENKNTIYKRKRSTIC